MEIEDKAKYLVEYGKFYPSQIENCKDKYDNVRSRWFDKYLKSKYCKRPR